VIAAGNLSTPAGMAKSWLAYVDADSLADDGADGDRRQSYVTGELYGHVSLKAVAVCLSARSLRSPFRILVWLD